MKKILNILTILLTLCLLSSSSCSNDDIPIEYVVGKHDVTFKVNPTTIISTFPVIASVEALNSNDILYDADGYTLRIRLFIYDNNGALLVSAEKKVSNYRQVAEFTFKELPEGNYTAISICDVIRNNDNYEFWTLADENKMSTLKLIENGHASGNEGRLVGVHNSSFTIKDNMVIECDLKPIGALIWTMFLDIHADLHGFIKNKYNKDVEISYIAYYCNIFGESIHFDHQGKSIVSLSSEDDYLYPIVTFVPEKITDNYYLDVGVLLPTSLYVRLGIGAVSSDNYLYVLDEKIVDNILIGASYFSGMDLSMREFQWTLWDYGNAPRVDINLDQLYHSRELLQPQQSTKQVIRISDVIN